MVEFVYEEKPSLIQQWLQLTEKGKAREDEKVEKVADDSTTRIRLYMHGAMKEKRRIKTTLVRSRATQRPSVTDLCWPIVYRTSDGRPEASQMESSSRRVHGKSVRHVTIESWRSLPPDNRGPLYSTRFLPFARVDISTLVLPPRTLPTTRFTTHHPIRTHSHPMATIRAG